MINRLRERRAESLPLLFGLAVLIGVGGHCLADEPVAKSAKSYPVISGIGVALRKEADQMLVGKVLPNSPAARSKQLTEGDRLVAVETAGKEFSVAGKSVGEVAGLIRGPVGTKVGLKIIPAESERTVQLTLRRDALEIEGVPSSTYEAFIGRRIDDLKLVSLNDKTSLQLSDLRGKVVVLDFWASWCAACFRPVEELQRYSARHPDWKEAVELIAVSVDSDPANALKVIEEKKWNRTRNVAIDFADLEQLGVKVVPVTIVVAPDGRIAAMAGSHAINVEQEVKRLLGH